MKYLKVFENYDDQSGWIISLDNILNNDDIRFILDKCHDMREDDDLVSIKYNIKPGEIVIVIYFTGIMESYLMKLGYDDDGNLGVSSDSDFYGLDFAYTVCDPEEYKKYNKNFKSFYKQIKKNPEMFFKTIKFNL